MRSLDLFEDSDEGVQISLLILNTFEAFVILLFR